MLNFLFDQQLYHFVRLNYDEYVGLLKRYLQEYTQNPRAVDMRVMYFNINRHIFNYLSSIRMFLDHNEYNLKKRYGSDSPRVKRFKKTCSQIYDNSFSYRFLYKLRNYVQHCGMPLGNLKLAAKESISAPNGIQRSTFCQSHVPASDAFFDLPDAVRGRYRFNAPWGLCRFQGLGHSCQDGQHLARLARNVLCALSLDVMLLRQPLARSIPLPLGGEACSAICVR